MLPYLAASGHNLYIKSARVYLQQMANLKEAHPDVHQCFKGGLHVIRRSDRLWVGLSSDLIIEQVLMISMKTSGGLTRGRGMTEQQHLMWLLSMPACAEVNQAMQELTGVNCSTGEQNNDLRKAIQARDWKDTLAVVQYLQGLNPFSNDPSMRNIATAVHAHPIISTSTQHAQLELPYWSRWRGKRVMNTASYGRTKLSLSAQSHLSRSTEWKPRLIQNSSSKDSSLLHRHQINWSPRSIMNYAATHQLCSIPLSCSETHTGQPLLMPSGSSWTWCSSRCPK